MQEEVSQWFLQALGVKCWLVQQQAGSRQAVDREQRAGSSPEGPATPASSEASDEALGITQSRSIGERLHHLPKVLH